MNDQELFEKIGRMHEEALKDMPTQRACVKAFISNKSTDKNEIEKTLDTLLNYAMLDVGREEFERLNTYYEGVSKGNAKFYWEQYNDLMGF